MALLFPATLLQTWTRRFQRRLRSRMPGNVPFPERRRRLHRYDIPGHARFLTFSCFQRRPFLTSPAVQQWLVESITRARDLHQFELWAFVIMPEHLHLLIRPRDDDPRVGPILTSIKQPVAQRAVAAARTLDTRLLERMADIDPKGEITHRLWQRGAGYDRNLWSADHIWEAINYIHRNPVERGLCTRAGDYEWSSAREFERRGAGPITLDDHRIPARVG